MNPSRVFILRPVGTALLAIGLMLLGITAYRQLPVASLPSIEFPTIRVSAGRPGADPETMAATVAAPLERRLGEIAGVTELTSTSTVGSTGITVQFDLTRKIDGAARDVQAAINAASADLPGDLPQVPTFRKFNPSSSPVLIVALTSSTMSASAIYDAADSIIAPRMTQVAGVADVSVSGADQPAIRVRADPSRLASMGLSIEDVRQAVVGATTVQPLGGIDGSTTGSTLATNDQLTTVADFKELTIKSANGTVVRLSDVASVEQGSRNSRSLAMFNRKPAVLLIITKQADANVLETVDAVKALIPDIKRWVPADLDIEILSDRTQTLRASVHDMQVTLMITIVLVMMVVWLFLRRSTPTIAAGITVPLTLAGTCALMWASGFSINNISLLALAVAVGFVVDDAIVMIENMYTNLEAGLTPLEAALQGAKQIGFTVVSISLSLFAAFIPLFFQSGVIGRLLKEFSWTLMFAILISTIVSLTVTPVICAYFIKVDHKPPNWLDRTFEGGLSAIVANYTRTLEIALRHKFLTIMTLLACVAATVYLYVSLPKGFFPQDDTGFIMAQTEAAADISFGEMAKLQDRAAAIIIADPAVQAMGGSVGSSGPMSGQMNQGRLFINLKPLAERGRMSTNQVIDRMRGKLGKLDGISVFLNSAQDVRVGGRQGKSQYQYTLWSQSIEDLVAAQPRVLAALSKVPGLLDVSTDRQQGGLQATVVVDRMTAARLGVAISSIDNALNNAFAQRQVATIYATRNQYKVVLEIDPKFQRDIGDLGRIFVPGAGGVQVPLMNLIKVERGLSPLGVNHTGPFPAVTITYNLAPDAKLDIATRGITQAIAELGLPATVIAEPAGDAKAFAQNAATQPLLILGALAAVYIVLGVLYESYIHPLTIISTLPSAGLGALLALQFAGMELSVIALIGIILLIGIVKKNGIMLVDFALDAQRRRGLSPEQAIEEACIERFRPILMTTLASLLGALPLALAEGPGSELRRPLGYAIFGGLIVSQILTLYTTPVVYLLLDRLSTQRQAGSAPSPHTAVPAE
jgi:multidrug efflux pump